MFEIGFSELLLVAVIGLLVLGPERLPTAIRTVSILMGRLRRQFNDIRAEVEREIGADDIRAQLHNERILDELNRSRAALEDTRRVVTSAAVPAAESGAGAAADSTPAHRAGQAAVPATDAGTKPASPGEP